mgnify:CR=1 FL=1
MKLSKNFSLAELTKSQTAERMGLENNPSELDYLLYIIGKIMLFVYHKMLV